MSETVRISGDLVPLVQSMISKVAEYQEPPPWGWGAEIQEGLRRFLRNNILLAPPRFHNDLHKLAELPTEVWLNLCMGKVKLQKVSGNEYELV